MQAYGMQRTIREEYKNRNKNKNKNERHRTVQSMRLWDRQAKLGESADLDGWWVGGEESHGVTA